MRERDPRLRPRATLRAVTARSEAPASFRSSSVRPGALELIQIGARDVLSRRRLIAYLVRADLKKRGSDTLLGNVWWVLDPLLQMLVYVVLVGVILQRGGPDFPLFILCAVLPWKWFQATVGEGLSSVVGMERLIKQINFPKLVLPVSAVMAGVVSFAFGLVPLFVITLLVYPHHATPWMLLIPVVAFVQLLFSLAVATTLSAVNVFYRDVGNLARHLLRFWFYLSPALYGMDLVAKMAEKYPAVNTWFAINPWTTLFNGYRDLVYEGRPPDWTGLLVLGLVSLLFLALATWLFKRVEPMFAKVL